MRGPLDVHRRLLDGGVPHEIVQLPRRISTAAELPEVLGVPETSCAVAHVVLADGRAHVVVLAAGSTWSARRTSRAVRARALRRGEADEVSAATEFTSGLVSPVGLPSDVPVVVDAAVARTDVVYTAIGDTVTALKIRGHDLVLATGAVVDAVADRAVAAGAAGPAESLRVARFAVRAL